MRFVFTLLLLLTFPSMALSQPSARFPSSIQVSHENVTYRAFDLGGFRNLLVMDAELSAAIDEIATLREQTALLNSAINNRTEAILELQENLEVLRQERERITALWEETDEQLQNEKHKPRAGPIAGWVTGVTFFLTSVVLTTYIVAHN